MSVYDEAATLEALLPKAMTVLFRTSEHDPLRHHSVGQIRLMRALLSGPKTAGDLSQSLGLSPSSLTQMASRMILAGLVSKESDTEDRRVRKLSLTPEGLELMRGRQHTRAHSAVAILETMEPEKRAQLIDLLEEIGNLNLESSFALVEAVV